MGELAIELIPCKDFKERIRLTKIYENKYHVVNKGYYILLYPKKGGKHV